MVVDFQLCRFQSTHRTDAGLFCLVGLVFLLQHECHAARCNTAAAWTSKFERHQVPLVSESDVDMGAMQTRHRHKILPGFARDQEKGGPKTWHQDDYVLL